MVFIRLKFCGAESIVYSGFYQPEEGIPRFVAVKQSIWNENNPCLTMRRKRLLAYFRQQLRHENLMFIEAWQESKGYLLSVETAGHPVKIEAPWPHEDIRPFARQMLDVLAYLHSNNYVHRDFKPDNTIYVNTRNKTKRYILTDLTTMLEIPLIPERIHTSLVGTVAFMPPNLIKNYVNGLKGIQTEEDQQHSHYGHDLMGYAESLINLLLGEHPTKIIGRMGTPSRIEIFELYGSEIQRLGSAARRGEQAFRVELNRFLERYSPTSRPTSMVQAEPWLSKLLFDIFTECDEADNATASVLFKRHFVAHSLRSGSPDQSLTLLSIPTNCKGKRPPLPSAAPIRPVLPYLPGPDFLPPPTAKNQTPKYLDLEPYP